MSLKHNIYYLYLTWACDRFRIQWKPWKLWESKQTTGLVFHAWRQCQFLHCIQTKCLTFLLFDPYKIGLENRNLAWYPLRRKLDIRTSPCFKPLRWHYQSKTLKWNQNQPQSPYWPPPTWVWVCHQQCQWRLDVGKWEIYRLLIHSSRWACREV